MISLLLTGALALFIISAVLAPIESLGWWAGWFGEKEAPPTGDEQNAKGGESAEIPQAAHYLVYLSGVGAITDDSIPEEEIKWLEALNKLMPGTELVTEVFPYSVNNAGLTNKRAFAWLWRRVEQMRLKNPMAIAALLVNVRNVLQVAVSADPRYGPIYNYGVAQEIVRALKAHGYRLKSGTPITLLGWSGGGQIALGTSTFLKGMLQAPIRIISIGGVMADDPGLDSIVRLDHYYGDKDPVQGLGAKAYAGRWPIAKQSAWNRALAQGKITMTSLGPLTHMGKGNYFDWETISSDGRPNAVLTLDAVAGSLAHEGLLTAHVESDGMPDAQDQPKADDPTVTTPTTQIYQVPNELPTKSE